MNEETLNKLLTAMENISNRLDRLEGATSGELQKLHAAMDLLATDQQDDVITTLQRIDAKITALLETQRLNFEILKIFSNDSVHH
jgi:SpoVK/Ycf46/Vps4 family AAA+-type ATPase